MKTGLHHHRNPIQLLMPEFRTPFLPSAEDQIDEAEKLAQRVRICRTLLCLPFAPVELYIYLGSTLRRIGLTEQAEAAYLEAIRKERGYAWAWFLYGSLLHTLKRVDEAKFCLERAVRLDPSLRNAWRRLAHVYDHQRCVIEGALARQRFNKLNLLAREFHRHTRHGAGLALIPSAHYRQSGGSKK